jgi:hypothetical protein
MPKRLNPVVSTKAIEKVAKDSKTELVLSAEGKNNWEILKPQH